MTPSLHHDRVASEGTSPRRWVMMLHGIYGSGRNWRSVARGLVDVRPEWGVLLVDLREHGKSLGFQPPHTLDRAAEDLRGLIDSEGLAVESILGHSFGGKVAMVYADHPVGRLTSLWVVDSSPDAREPSGSAWRMLGVLEDHPGPFPDRESAIEAVQAGGFSLPVAQWMTTNLDRSPEGDYRWRLRVEDVRSLLLDFFRTDTWPVVESPPDGLEVHVVKARESSLLDDRACRRIEAAGSHTGTAHLHVLDGGHWLNVDNPEGLIELLASTL
jgi:esterase